MSEIVIKDEAKSQNYVIFVSDFDAVDANYHLSVPDGVLDLLGLVCNVHHLRAEGQFTVTVDHQEACCVLIVTGSQAMYSHAHFYRLILVKGSKLR